MWALTAFEKNPAIFEPFLPVIDAFRDHENWPTLEDLQCFLQAREPVFTSTDQRLHVVSNLKQSYEEQVFLSGALLTREQSWHDFLNLMVWVSFPKLKAEINRLHYQNIGVSRLGVRNTAQNRLTHLDESGILVITGHPDYERALAEHDWQRLFVTERQAFHAKTQYYMIGHGKLEQAMDPFVGLTAKAWVINVEPGECVDSLAASKLEKRLEQPWQALPILGIPGCWPANESDDFYANLSYFRPKRAAVDQ